MSNNAEVVDLISRMVEKGYLVMRINETSEMHFSLGPEPPVEDKQMHAFWRFLKQQED